MARGRRPTARDRAALERERASLRRERARIARDYRNAQRAAKERQREAISELRHLRDELARELVRTRDWSERYAKRIAGARLKAEREGRELAPGAARGHKPHEHRERRRRAIERGELTERDRAFVRRQMDRPGSGVDSSDPEQLAAAYADFREMADPAMREAIRARVLREQAAYVERGRKIKRHIAEYFEELAAAGLVPDFRMLTASFYYYYHV